MRGKLPTEIFTPLYIIDAMVEKTFLASHKTIYDPACGDGNILCYIVEVLKKNFSEDSIINIIFGADISQDNVDKCKARLADLLPSVSEHKINAHIKCRNTLLAPEYFTYDLIIMNPPYERDLHKKFLLWSLVHAKEIVSIQPCQFLYKHNNLRKIDSECQSAVDKYCTSIDILNPNTIWPDHTFASPVGIFHFLKKRNDYLINVNDKMTNDVYTVTNCNSIIKDYSKLKTFYQKLETFLTDHDNLKDYLESQPSKEWVVSFPRVRGHIRKNADNMYGYIDFATIATKSNKPIHKSEALTNRQNFSFDTETEANNFLSYIKTDFARTCLYLSKHGVHLDNNEFAGIPYLDFNCIYTDDILFNMIGCNNPHVVPNYYN